jgi:hypothetical protein
LSVYLTIFSNCTAARGERVVLGREVDVTNFEARTPQDIQHSRAPMLCPYYDTRPAMIELL